jgi:hypothetical protein
VSNIDSREPSLTWICVCATVAIVPGYAVAFAIGSSIPWVANLIFGLLTSLALSCLYARTRAGSTPRDVAFAATWTAVSYVLGGVGAYVTLWVLVISGGGLSG